jgi:hypothetical protein
MRSVPPLSALAALTALRIEGSALPALTALAAFLKQGRKARSSGGKRVVGGLPRLLAMHSAKEDLIRGTG